MANSLDTNILVYAANLDCPEHAAALEVVDRALAEPREWILAEQVLLEFYKALRHPRILARPLGAREAAAQVRFLREESGFQVCCPEMAHWGDVFRGLDTPDFPYQRTFDLVLGVTLRRNGVRTFYTRNTADFAGLGFEQVLNPIDR